MVRSVLTKLSLIVTAYNCLADVLASMLSTVNRSTLGNGLGSGGIFFVYRSGSLNRASYFVVVISIPSNTSIFSIRHYPYPTTSQSWMRNYNIPDIGYLHIWDLRLQRDPLGHRLGLFRYRPSSALRFPLRTIDCDAPESDCLPWCILAGRILRPSHSWMVQSDHPLQGISSYGYLRAQGRLLSYRLKVRWQ